MSALGWRERVCCERKVLAIYVHHSRRCRLLYPRTTYSAPSITRVALGEGDVCGRGWPDWGCAVVYGKSRLTRTACRAGRWPDGVQGGWCRWSRRRCSLHEPSPLSCAGESVLADHRRRTDGQTDRTCTVLSSCSSSSSSSVNNIIIESRGCVRRRSFIEYTQTK